MMSRLWYRRADAIAGSGSEGHTLAEMVVALMLLFTVLVPTGMALMYAMENRESRNLTHAIVLAQSAMEETMGTICPHASEYVENGLQVETRVSSQGNVWWYDVSVRRLSSERRLIALRSAQLRSSATCLEERP